MRDHANLKAISDVELLRRLIRHVSDSRRVEADLVADIAEVDERRLYAREAAPSMYAYCTERLHLSEAEAWLRIRVARASPGFSPEAGRLQDQAADRRLVAEVAPREDAPARIRIRKLPARRAQAAPAPAPGLSPETVEGANSQLTPFARPSARSTRVEPLAPAHFKVQFTASECSP